ncbi:glycosyltransferase [Peribacillus sp. NPDC097295]|uniref:glycosyltransferase n=1 Tax=Peribacillus sp. NPDC097295 TaxID=3364402 RepID=UPI00382BF42A
MQISIVILHYLTEQDTIECIESILKNVKYENYKILVVDNGSPNGSGNRLKIKYEKYSKVDIILTNKNLGFAKGNNIGFLKAKNYYHADFILLINNDTIIEQKDFLEKLISVYNKHKFALMGPDIISTVDRYHQNPQPLRIDRRKDVLFQITRHLALLIMNYLRLESIVKKILKIFKQEKGFASNHSKVLKNVQLHGSCLIFSPEYIKDYDGLYDKTFMYFEEDILFYLCKKNKLKTLYSPELVIFHKEDSATNEYLKNNLQKNRFIYKESLKSIFHLLRLMD